MTETDANEVREKHRFDSRKVQNWLEERLPGFQGPIEVQQFSFGQSNPTYLLQSPSGRYVLRRKPPGKLLPSAHAVDREFRVISAVHRQGFPVAEPLVLCEDESIAGTVFYLMSYVEGRLFPANKLDQAPEEQRGAMIDDFIAVMSRLHAMDPDRIGLGDFGRPGNYFARQVSRWSKQYRASETEKIEEMDLLMDWLPQNVPEDDSSCVVHGDYSLHNVLFHPTEPRLVAVLDWELSTIGHPFGDLFYATMPWYAPHERLGRIDPAQMDRLKLPSLDAVLARYCALSGRQLKDAEQSFFKAYTLFRIAAILQGIIGRVRDGTAAAAHQDAMAMAAQVQPLAHAAWVQVA